jgi:hypothetical protein
MIGFCPSELVLPQSRSMPASGQDARSVVLCRSLLSWPGNAARRESPMSTPESRALTKVAL